MQEVQEYYGEEMNDEVVNKISKTWDYDKFTFFKGNRNIKPHHKNKLAESFKIKQLPIPIIVDELFRIADGQHRLEVCKDLGLPIYYSVISNIEMDDVQRVNENMLKWGYSDYLKLFMDQGKDSYFLYNDFKNTYGFNHNETLHLLYCVKPGYIERRSEPRLVVSSGATYDFRNGNLKIFDHDESSSLAEQILLTKPYYKGYHKRNFILALLRCFGNENYNHKEFIRKLSNQPDKMTDHTTIDDYLQKIQKIYNFQSRKRVRLYYPKL